MLVIWFDVNHQRGTYAGLSLRLMIYFFKWSISDYMVMDFHYEYIMSNFSI